MRLEPIADAGDPRVRDYVDLRDPAPRGAEVFVAEGRGVVRRLLTAGRFRVRSVLVTAPALERLRDVLEPLDAATPVYLAAQETVRRLVGFDFHRGCLAVGERGPEASLAAVLGTAVPRLVVGLEALANADNVGGVFRNAMAFGAGAAVLSPTAADPLYRKAIRVSAGATLVVPFARPPDWPAALRALREAGFLLVALSTRADAVDIATLAPIPGPVVLLLGHEGDGLAPETLAAADLEVTIPMAPGADALNVATASGIALHRLRAWR